MATPASTAPSQVRTQGHPFWFGGVSSALATFCTHPLDLLKVRLQTVGTTTMHVSGSVALGNGTSTVITSLRSSRPTLRHVLVQLVREESVFGLFNGLSAALLRQLTYSTVRFAAYEELKQRWTVAGVALPLHQTVAAGVIAGGLAGVAGNPADVINVRMQNDGKLPAAERRNYKHAMDGFLRIWREEGATTLFRGLSANVNRGMVMTASQLGSYDYCKSLLLGSGMFREDIRTHFTASLLAGLVATTVSNPVDICKTRIMSAAQSRAGIAPPYKGTVDAFVKIIRDEGPRALFKGWLPSYSRLGPQTILTFIFLEWMKDVYYRGR